jgi:hypothetical protein
MFKVICPGLIFFVLVLRLESLKGFAEKREILSNCHANFCKEYFFTCVLIAKVWVRRFGYMQEAKNTARAVVRIGFDGRVHKYFKGLQARERYENEVRVLRFLEERQCPFVPRILEAVDEDLYLVTTNCGGRVERISNEKKESLFAELENYGVRHDDAEVRNITYNSWTGSFCIIDFEFATILEPGYPPSPEMLSEPDRSKWVQ